MAQAGIGGEGRGAHRFAAWPLTMLIAAAIMLLALPGSATAQGHGQRPRGAESQRPPMPPERPMPFDRPSPHQTRPLPDIVAEVQATPPYRDMDYIGVAGFETRTMIYVLRFLDGRRVVVVQVDARSGRIIGQPR